MSSLSFKKSSEAGKKPLPSQLVEGELAVNTEDRILYTKDSKSSIVSLGINKSNVYNYLTPKFKELNRGYIYTGMAGLGLDGKIYLWGNTRREYYGASNLAVNGFFEIDLPYEKCDGVKDWIWDHLTCYVLFNNGDLYTWGQNQNAQCGVGNVTDPCPFPTKIASNVDRIFIRTDSHTQNRTSNALMLKDGTIKVWGSNTGDRMPIPNTEDNILRPTTITLPSGYTFKDVKNFWNVGGYLTAMFVQFNDLKVFGCGYNAQGQIGVGNTTGEIKQLTELKVVSGKAIKDITGGYGERWITEGTSTASDAHSFTVFLTEGGEVYTAGHNNFGAIGRGAVGGADQSTPYKVNLPESIDWVRAYGQGPGSVWVGNKAKTKLWRWGYNTDCILGNGTETHSGTPTVLDIPYKEIYGMDGGWTYSYRFCMLLQKPDGSLMGWGLNSSQQLCLNSTADIRTPTNLPVQSMLNVKAIKIMPEGFGDRQVMVYYLTEDGDLYVSGYAGNVGMIAGLNNRVVVNPLSTPRKMT